MFKYIKSFKFLSSNLSFNLNSKFLDKFFFSKKLYLSPRKKLINSIYYLVIINKFKHFSVERFIYASRRFRKSRLVFSGYVEKDFIMIKYYYDNPLLLV